MMTSETVNPSRLRASRFVVGRQPILDRQGVTHGYELLYRDTVEAVGAEFVDGNVATAQVLVNSLTEIGLDDLIGERHGFINLTAQYLANPELLNSVPPERVVLEVLEDVQPTEEVVAGIKHLLSLGYRFAADDFVHTPDRISLLEHMAYVKYEIHSIPPNEMRAAIELDRAAGRTVVLERVESLEDYELGMQLGADLFQGYFFARPTTITATSVAPNVVTVMELLGEVSDPEAGLLDVADVLSRDVSLSVRALRFVNSASIGLGESVDSITQAASMIGRDKLRSWALLAMLASFDRHPDELGTLMLTRARACSYIAEHLETADPDTAYTVGMLSLVDVMTGVRMSAALSSMPVSDAVRDALLGKPGPLHEVLSLVHQIEQAQDNEDVPFELVKIYFDAVCWAQQFRAEVGDNV